MHFGSVRYVRNPHLKVRQVNVDRSGGPQPARPMRVGICISVIRCWPDVLPAATGHGHVARIILVAVAADRSAFGRTGFSDAGQLCAPFARMVQTQGMIAKPSDREAASRAKWKQQGRKVHSFYVTTGETDWRIIAEFPDGVDLIPALSVVGASGAVSNVKTVRAYTAPEFKAAQEKEGKIASSYKAPAK